MGSRSKGQANENLMFMEQPYSKNSIPEFEPRTMSSQGEPPVVRMSHQDPSRIIMVTWNALLIVKDTALTMMVQPEA